MLSNKPLDKIVFISIDTVSQYKSFTELPDNLKEMFKKRYSFHIEKLQEKEVERLMLAQDKADIDYNALAVKLLETAYQDKAALTAEFGKICCISAGLVDGNNKLQTFSFQSADEKEILNWLSERKPIKSFNIADKDTYHFVTFAGKSFDYSFLAKRYLLNGLEIPTVFAIGGMKSWDIKHLFDISEDYRFANFGGEYTSLELLSTLLGIEVSLTKGEAINAMYYSGHDHIVSEIKKHCEDKIWSLASVYCKMKNLIKSITR